MTAKARKPTTRQTRKKRMSLYSFAWLERYGRGLTRDEIRLVQAARGLPATKRTWLITLASEMVIEQAKGGGR